ncbi:hypothetical protein H5410_041371, partial [Solanum commersonii]
VEVSHEEVEEKERIENSIVQISHLLQQILRSPLPFRQSLKKKAKDANSRFCQVHEGFGYKEGNNEF